MKNEFDWAREIHDFSSRLKSYFETFERPNHTTGQFTPKADAYVVEGVYHVDVELPGMKKDDIRITMSGSVLEISGEKKAARPDGARTILSGRRYGNFTKQIQLPPDADVDLANATATYENGVLHVALPRRVKEQGSTIPIG